MESPKKLHPGIAALIVVVLIGIVVSAIIVVNNLESEPAINTPTPGAVQSQDTGVPTESTDTSEYANGTYRATGSYISPGGRESIELSVTIKNGVITSTDLVQNATDREAKQYQSQFANNYKALVVGKNIDEVSLSRVAGSSLTSNGFNDALDQIKSDARA